MSIAHLNEDHALLERPNRNYFRMLQKFERVFGREAIATRLYRPGTWRDGSIVWDLLEFLECPPDDQITPSEQRQNSSLDAQSAAVLNAFDSYGKHGAGREALVEDLLWLIQKYPGGSHYFLDEAAVRHIRETYRNSNAMVARHYGVEFDYRPCVAEAASASNGSGVSYVDELARLARYPRWQGESLQGQALSTLLRYSSGWSRFEDWGVWTLDDVSHLQFRLPLARFTGFEDSFILNFNGRYFADNTATQIWTDNGLLGDFDLTDGAVKMPIALLDTNRVLKLELRHHAAVAPADLERGSDKRRLAYGLQGLSYQFSR